MYCHIHVSVLLSDCKQSITSLSLLAGTTVVCQIWTQICHLPKIMAGLSFLMSFTISPTFSRKDFEPTYPEDDNENRYIENTRWGSFDIKFTRQGFENACWHREACRAIQHAFSKPSLVNLISKDANLVFYLSGNPLLNTLQTSDYDVFFDFCVVSASLATLFKKCNVIMTW